MPLPKVLIPIRRSDGGFDVFEANPVELDWPDLRKLWQRAGIKRPLCFAPPDSKLDIFFSYACQEAGLPISLGTVFNPGWSDMFLSKVQHDCLVISADLVCYLAEHRLFETHLGQLKQIVIVGEVSQQAYDALVALVHNETCQRLSHPAQELVP